MTIHIFWPHTTRVFSNCTQAEVNSVITYISQLQEEQGAVHVKIIVE